MYRPYYNSPPHRSSKKCARALIPLLIWFFVAFRLWYGNCGNNRLFLGPSSSRIVKTSSVFVKEINVKGKENRGLFLYGFSDRPELGSETNNSTTRYSLFLDSFNHQEFSLWLNKGSKLSMKWRNVDVLHGGVTNGDQVLLVSINKGHRQNLKSLKRYEYLESQEINELKYIVEEDNTYNIAIENLNQQGIAMDLNVSVSSTMYDTTKATSFCSVTNTTCKLKLDFPRCHYFVLTTSNSEDHNEEWSSVEITFTARIVTYFFILGVVVGVVWIILYQLEECGNAERQRTQEEIRESEPILATTKDQFLCKYGTSEDPETSLSGSFTDIYDEKICILCYEESRTCFFTPCGHSISCFSCAQRIMKEENKLCPICRRLIHKLRKLPGL